MFEIDRTDFQILTAFKVVDEEAVITLDKPTDGITIVEIMEYLDSVVLCQDLVQVKMRFSSS